MCGIIGYINYGNKELLEKCTDVLKHRGPDDEGVMWFDEWNSGFGHRRLSIIDLTDGGHQPMVSDDGRYVITYNGEIYNYKELAIELRVMSDELRVRTKSDTEILLLSYIAWGEKCLERLNGMFAFAVFDRENGELFAARDRIGIKPMYYCVVGDSMVFASEIKAILESGIVKAEPDYEALKTQMHFQSAPMTGFKGIFKLEAGTFLRFKVRPQITQINTNEEQRTLATEDTKDTESNYQLSDINEQLRDKELLSTDFTNEKSGDNEMSDEVTKKQSDNVGDVIVDSRLKHSGMTGGVEIRKWWDIEVREDGKFMRRDTGRHAEMDKKFLVNKEIKYSREKSEKELVEELDWLLNDAVRLQMVADVPVGILLSGGLDSSIIAAMMRKQYAGPVNAFTIKFSEQDQKFEKLEDDSKWAKKVADLFEFNYTEIIIKPDVEKLLKDSMYHLDEPIADPAAINTFLISESARMENIVVLLTGMGGDEVFGGYRKHLACLKADYYQKTFPKFLRNFFERRFENINVASDKEGFKWLRWAKRFLSFASYERFERFLLSDLGVPVNVFDELFVNSDGFDKTHYFRKQKEVFNTPADDVSYLSRMCLCDTKTFLTDHNLNYSDKASMMAGVELRPPLADHRIVEFMFSLPPKYRINGNMQKYLLKKVAEKYLPKEVVHRPKAPFGSPLRSWIRGPLAAEIDKKLSRENIIKRGLFNPDVVRDFIKKDREGKQDYAHLVWRFLATEEWFERFFDKEQSAR